MHCSSGGLTLILSRRHMSPLNTPPEVVEVTQQGKLVLFSFCSPPSSFFNQSALHPIRSQTTLFLKKTIASCLQG